jgi:L-serine/L-threonine ammonia-lyase
MMNRLRLVHALERDPLHVATPYIEDVQTSSSIERRVFLKMECCQPIGSFKIRGIGLLCQSSVAAGKRVFVSSSGGNAGFAVAYAARALGVAATIVVPSSTAATTCQLLRAYGARVIVHGDAWDDADVHARQLAASADAAYIPPFDHPVIWEGHASLVDEMRFSGPRPDVVVVAVGGGGLMCGVLEGLQRGGWQDVKVIAVETQGCESLHRSMLAGELVTLPAITSIAKSLGARRVAAAALAWTRRHPVTSAVVSDHSAIKAAVRFAHRHRVLVEPACGAALAVVHENHAALGDAACVAVVVCGGIAVHDVSSRLAATGDES